MSVSQPEVRELDIDVRFKIFIVAFLLLHFSEKHDEKYTFYYIIARLHSV